MAAVAYAYGANGMWGDMTGLKYVDNYYSACGTSDHPSNQSALIAAANGPPYTTRDANCHLLWAAADAGTSDPQLGVPAAGPGHAFHEHSGIGAGGVKKGGPFTVYWYDDNSLTRAMSDAYGTPAADGLVPFGDFTRWAVIRGDAASWHNEPYGAAGNPTSDCCIDTMALNGLYDLAGGNFAGAVKEWNSLVAKSGATYDNPTQRFVYPSIVSNYHMGLFKVLTDQMMGDPGAAASKNPTLATLLQHSIALDSNILDLQEHDATGPIGWVTNIPAGTSLINIETITCEVLGLGARANSVFEPGVAPLVNDANGYFERPYHALSAVGSAGSKPGYMTRGPGFDAPAGKYTFDFRLRAPAPTGKVATISIYDAASSTVLATHDVDASEMATANQWTQISITAAIPSGCHAIELRTYWTGTGNLDVGPIRVR